MLKIVFILLSCLILTSCCSTKLYFSGVRQSEKPSIHNYGDQFEEYWKVAEGASESERMSSFAKVLRPVFPAFYSYKIEKWREQGRNPSAELSEQIREFPQIRQMYQAKLEQITGNLTTALQSFTATFPDMKQDFDVYLIHSLGDMDGGTRLIGGKVYFILGIDGMVKHHNGFQSETPFFHHELFHVYHSQFLDEDKVIWVSLWAEGLATYVAKFLNPQASDRDLLLDLPHGLINKVRETWVDHWNDLESKLESRADLDYKSYFLINSPSKKIAPRAGYYLGFLIVQELAKNKSSQELARLRKSEILPLIKQTIKKLKSEKVHSE